MSGRKRGWLIVGRPAAKENKMTGRAFRTGIEAGLIVLAAGSMLLLGGCGKKQTASGNVVQMRDMQVVDGTTNDEMTDLDAVRSNGIGVGNNVAAGAVDKKVTATTKAAKGATDTEDVPTE